MDPQFGSYGQSSSHGKYTDVESQEEVPLVPGLSKLDNTLRWGFIRKVYGIISAQLVLTAVVAAIIMFNHPVRSFVTGSLAFQIVVAILPLIGLIPLYIYQRNHPTNLILLGLWTACLSIGVGTACTLYQPFIVLEAVVLTASIVVGLTAYTFYAARKGANFSYMQPLLFNCLLALVIWSFFQLFFPPGPVQQTIFGLLGAILFSAYIVLDTDNLIQRYDLDQYIWAAVSLYLDILNLFLKVLQLMGNRRD